MGQYLKCLFKVNMGKDLMVELDNNKKTQKWEQRVSLAKKTDSYLTEGKKHRIINYSWMQANVKT